MSQEQNTSELQSGLRTFCRLTPRQRHALIEIMEEMLAMNAEQQAVAPAPPAARLYLVR